MKASIAVVVMASTSILLTLGLAVNGYVHGDSLTEAAKTAAPTVPILGFLVFYHWKRLRGQI
ncbi:MAG: hypothetical protein AB7F35_12250 [Acetobacteraceae bacterium]